MTPDPLLTLVSLALIGTCTGVRLLNGRRTLAQALGDGVVIAAVVLVAALVILVAIAVMAGTA